MNKEHKRKLHRARKMMTAEEIKSHTPPFASKAWQKKGEAAKIRVAKKKKKFKIRKMVAKKNKKKAPK